MHKILKRTWAPLWLATMLAQPILAQTWTPKMPAAKPPARYFTSLASLEQQRKIVLFGGLIVQDGKLVAGRDTWLWDGETWTQFTGAAPQMLKGLYAMAADGPSSVVAFGGVPDDEFEPENQTWRFDGSTWKQIVGDVTPAYGQGQAMAYDRDAKQIVMYGGNPYTGETNLFKDSVWSRVVTQAFPAVTEGLALAYDADRRQVVLFGGLGLDGKAPVNDTWVWDSVSTTWTRKTPAHSPPARFGHGLAYDSATHRVVLFGGANSITSAAGLRDTWTWDGTDWTQLNLATAPPARVFFGFAGRSWAGGAVLFGGFDWTTDPGVDNDTWVWQGPPYVALVQQPINPNGSSVFNANRGVVPVKFTLTQGGIQTCTLPPATISVQRIANGTATGVDEILFTQAADSGSNFRIDAPNCQYVYNLSASALSVGTYQVNILIDGSVVGSATFGLK